LKKIVQSTKIQKIYFSSSAFKRLSKKTLKEIQKMDISVFVVRRSSGRPNLLEKNLEVVSQKVKLNLFIPKQKTILYK